MKLNLNRGDNHSNIILALLLVLVILISGCAIKPELAERQKQLERQQQQPGCDGICDQYEQQHEESPCYQPDCLGKTEGIGQTEESQKDNQKGKHDQKGEQQQPVTSQEQTQPQYQPQLGKPSFSVKITEAKYETISSKPTGWFTSGQNADLLLSGIGFNNAGGPLLFNHPGAIASDGQHLLLADRNNNRILIWNNLPTSNLPPDLVLGQKDFYSNNPGEGPEQLNWPVGVATDGKHIVVADTYNDRILIWNSFPTENGQPADLEIKDAGGGQSDKSQAKRRVSWPWAVWTDGEKLVVTSTGTSSVLIWNTFPSQKDQPADLVLYAKGMFGTPRSIGSDGKSFLIGDHNAKVVGGKGNYFWKTFPATDDQPYDFFMATAEKTAALQEGQKESKINLQGEVFWGPTFTTEGKFLVLGPNLNLWDSFPEDKNDAPDLVVGSSPGPEITEGYHFFSGDGSGTAFINGKLYLSLTNGNKIVGYNSIPAKAEQVPDFVLGSPDLYTNTLETNFIFSNPIPATDGKSLFVTSDFDRKLFVWKNMPDESNAYPDLVYDLPEGPWDSALFKNNFVLAGKKNVYLWKTLPTEGQLPDITFESSIGEVQFKELKGVALDEKYFYLADVMANKIYVWEGIPTQNSDSAFILNLDKPTRLSSDGKYLAVARTESGPGGAISVYNIADLSEKTKPVNLQIKHNLPQDVLVYEGQLFVSDTNFNRVLAWKDIEEAISGKSPDQVLGAENLEETKPEIGANKLFWPAGLAFDGSYLWVGEFKFSERLLRYSVS